MSFIRRIKEGGVYPGRWYGVAYDEWGDDGCVSVVCLPIPLNVVASLWHGFWLRMRRGRPWRSWGADYVCRKCQKRLGESE